MSKKSNKDVRFCSGFVSFACVSDICPNIPTEYDVEEYSKHISCSKCFYRTGKCEDCIFEDTIYCISPFAKSSGAGAEPQV